MRLISAPLSFDEAFLAWFRARTEAAWSTYTPRTFEDYVRAGVGGLDWQRDTRWLHGLTEAEISAAEARWQLRFPPDFRLFLAQLHTIDRPCTGALFRGMRSEEQEDTLQPVSLPAFYDWKTEDGSAIQRAYERIIDGLCFDVTHNQLWPTSWGQKPATEEGQRERVQEVVAAAPKLIPVFEHRFLLAEPCEAGNPVLSIYQSDMIVYGANLRDHLLIEFHDLIDKRYSLSRPTFYKRYAITNKGKMDYRTIPFWGEFLF